MTAASRTRDRERRIYDSIISVVEAVLIAVAIRTFLFQPFDIPSGSMEPTLRVGDYLFVSKFTYGYSRFSIPFSPPLFKGRILGSLPHHGDVVVFRHGSVDFIKRVIGLPGDRVQVINGALYLNGQPVKRQRVADFVGRNPCSPAAPNAPPVHVPQWRETLPNGVSYDTLQCAEFTGFPDFTQVYTVPPGHLFMMGDNRENSEDSRFPEVGYVPVVDLIGRAQVIFFSIAPGQSVWEFWNWWWSIRWDRLFTVIR